MEIAVFSDIHGNYEAFKQCVDLVLGRGIRTFIFLGDYLGEFPYPQKTMGLLYALKEAYTCFFVKGNKEDYWIDRKYNPACEWRDGDLTVGAMEYCYAHQTNRDIGFFQSLPLSQEITFPDAPALLACHGSPNRNNEKMLPADDRTNQLIDACPCQYILCGHTHLQGTIHHGGKTVWNPGAVGVPQRSGGKAQFMILHQAMQAWTAEFISVSYDVEQVIQDLLESGLEESAPYWTQVTKHLIRTGEVPHTMVLAKAMALCEHATGRSVWHDIPPVYWEKALAELLT